MTKFQQLLKTSTRDLTPKIVAQLHRETEHWVRTHFEFLQRMYLKGYARNLEFPAVLGAPVECRGLSSSMERLNGLGERYADFRWWSMDLVSYREFIGYFSGTDLSKDPQVNPPLGKFLVVISGGSKHSVTSFCEEP